MKRDQLIVECQCGAITGERCEWTGPVDQTVLVEYMPEYLRASHVAAGNRGVWPHNGSERLHLSAECAETWTRDDPEWVTRVEEAGDVPA